MTISSDTDSERVIAVLQRHRTLDGRELARARAAADASGEALHVAVCRLGLVDEATMADAIAEALGIPLFGMADFPAQPVLNGVITPAFLRDARVLPIYQDSDAVTIAMADPLNEKTLRTLGLFLEIAIRPGVAVPADLDRYFARLYGDDGGLAGTEPAPSPARADRADVERLREMASETPVVRVVNTLIARAVADRASDIHLVPQSNSLLVRQRIDGVLHPGEPLQPDLHAGIVSRIKILAQLDILERRRPQDGRFRMNVQGREIDVRVSILPTMHGESVALRVLDKAGLALAIETLGLNKHVVRQLGALLGEANGILLVTGPTGSGKTTTLYAALQRLDDGHRNLITIEDPIEYELTGIRQIQTDARIGLTFASILRSILRHDPDVILVGEIRDLETAQIAIQAALTGHLVLATLHSNGAATAITRLTDMGVEPYLVTSALRGVIAQRLVRVLCPLCREAGTAQPQALAEIGGAPDLAPQSARGCAACEQTGYRGRTPVSELLVLDDTIRACILERGDAMRIEEVAAQQGMIAIKQDALDKVAKGITSVEEVVRVTGVI